MALADNIGKAYGNILNDDFSRVTLEGTLPDPLRNQTLDDWVVKGARVSFRGKSGDKEKDAGLLNYLISHEHWSPVEQPHMTFSIRAPMAVIIHLLRHRTFHVNGESSRFKEPKDEYYFPAIWRKQDTVNKQSSFGTVEEMNIIEGLQQAALTTAKEAYDQAIRLGVAREQARLLLPTDANYRSYVITTDLRNFMNFVGLRAANDAQWETRQYACAMYWLVQPMMPNLSKVWMEKIAGPSVSSNLTEWKKSHGEPATAVTD